MRKAQKENAEALTDLLKRAHDEIRRAVERKKSLLHWHFWRTVSRRQFRWAD